MTPAGNGHSVVPAFVNGKGTVPFILDTGADGSSVYEWFAKQQGFKIGEPASVAGMTGTTVAPTYRIDSLSVDGRTIANVEATGLPDRKDAEIAAGVTGNDLMDGSIATFDYPCRTVALTPKPVVMSQLLKPQAAIVEGGSVSEGTQLTFPVTINGIIGTAVLDTGSRGTQINPMFAQSAKIDTNGPGFGPGETLYGAASIAIETREGKIAKLSFAGRSVTDLTVRVADLSVFKVFGIADRPAMIFGMNALKIFRLVYDHAAKRFWFDQSRCKPTA